MDKVPGGPGSCCGASAAPPSAGTPENITVRQGIAVYALVIVKMNLVTPSSLTQEMFSLWLLRMVLTIYSPRPTPSRSAEREWSVLWKRSKMSCCSSGGMVSP